MVMQVTSTHEFHFENANTRERVGRVHLKYLNDVFVAAVGKSLALALQVPAQERR